MKNKLLLAAPLASAVFLAGCQTQPVAMTPAELMPGKNRIAIETVEAIDGYYDIIAGKQYEPFT